MSKEDPKEYKLSDQEVKDKLKKEIKRKKEAELWKEYLKQFS